MPPILHVAELSQLVLDVATHEEIGRVEASQIVLDVAVHEELGRVEMTQAVMDIAVPEHNRDFPRPDESGPFLRDAQGADLLNYYPRWMNVYDPPVPD